MSKPLHDREYQHFLAELRALREESQVTQTELGRLLKEDQTFVSKVERGVRRLDVVELRRWTRALGISAGDFIERFEQRLERHRVAPPPRPSAKVRTRGG
jgi:transcriptional regulator with XRE-family HTH domain